MALQSHPKRFEYISRTGLETRPHILVSGMAITRSSAADRTKSGIPTGRKPEFLLLFLVSTALALGIGLMLLAQSREMEESVSGIPGGKLLDLNNIRSSAELQSGLGF